MNFALQKLLYALGLLLAAYLLWQLYGNDHVYQSWPTSPGRLISAQVVTGQHKLQRYFAVETTYDFVVNGKTYTSNLNKIGRQRFSSDKEALKSLAELKSQPEIRVYYDPSNPDRNTIGR